MISTQPPHDVLAVSPRTLADALCLAIQQREITTGAVITDETTGENGMVYHNRLRGFAGTNGNSCRSCDALAEQVINNITVIHQGLRKYGYTLDGTKE